MNIRNLQVRPKGEKSFQISGEVEGDRITLAEIRRGQNIPPELFNQVLTKLAIYLPEEFQNGLDF